MTVTIPFKIFKSAINIKMVVKISLVLLGILFIVSRITAQSYEENDQGLADITFKEAEIDTDTVATSELFEITTEEPPEDEDEEPVKLHPKARSKLTKEGNGKHAELLSDHHKLVTKYRNNRQKNLPYVEGKVKKGSKLKLDAIHIDGCLYTKDGGKHICRLQRLKPAKMQAALTVIDDITDSTNHLFLDIRGKLFWGIEASFPGYDPTDVCKDRVKCPLTKGQKFVVGADINVPFLAPQSIDAVLVVRNEKKDELMKIEIKIHFYW